MHDPTWPHWLAQMINLPVYLLHTLAAFHFQGLPYVVHVASRPEPAGRVKGKPTCMHCLFAHGNYLVCFSSRKHDRGRIESEEVEEGKVGGGEGRALTGRKMKPTRRGRMSRSITHLRRGILPFPHDSDPS
jgi:hypothetical protein